MMLGRLAQRRVLQPGQVGVEDLRLFLLTLGVGRMPSAFQRRGNRFQRCRQRLSLCRRVGCRLSDPR